MHRISHCFIMDAPNLDRPIFVTDAAINTFPTMEDKMNAIDLAHSLGIEKPKVAILSAMETINPKLQSTIEAGALYKMADRGQLILTSRADRWRPPQHCEQGNRRPVAVPLAAFQNTAGTYLYG